MKKKLIPKHQVGKKILKLIESFGNAQISGDSGIGTSMAIASGYLYNPKTGKWELSEENLKEAEPLRNNLTVLSTFSPTHPASVIIDKALVPIASSAYKNIKNYGLAKALTNQLDNAKVIFPKSDILSNSIYVSEKPMLIKDRLKYWKKATKRAKKESENYEAWFEKSQFMKNYEEFAKKYGYESLDPSKTYSNSALNHKARKLIRRHNTFARGVTIEENEKRFIGSVRERLRSALQDSPSLYMSLDETALMYGPKHFNFNKGRVVHFNKKGEYRGTFLLLRPYSLGDNRLNWFKDGDFPILLMTNEAFNGNGIPGAIYSRWYREPVYKYIPHEVEAWKLNPKIIREIKLSEVDNFGKLTSKKLHTGD